MMITSVYFDGCKKLIFDGIIAINIGGNRDMRQCAYNISEVVI